MKNVEIAEGGIGRRLNGTRSIITDEPNTDLMDFWVDADDRKTKTLYITQNGSYNAEADGVYAYSSITVSVRGGSSGSNDDGGGGGVVPTFPTFPEYTDENGDPLDPTLFPEIPLIDIEDIDFPALIPTIEDENGNDTPIDQLFPEILEDPLADVGEIKLPDTVGEEGSAITGIDPEDGYTYMVDVDENGNLEVEKVPTDIKITQPPNKTEYEFGDAVDYDGMEVSLVDKDGNVVKTKEYPTGKLPLDDESLDLPTETIPEIEDRSDVKGTWTAKSGLRIPDLVCISNAEWLERWTHFGNNHTYEERDTRSGIMVVERAYSGYFEALYVSNSRDSVGYNYTVERKDLTIGEITYQDSGFANVGGNTHRSYTYAGKTAYFDGLGSGMSHVVESNVPDTNVNLYGFEGPAAWTALYGDMTANQELEAEWTSPYSGVVYKDGTTVVTSEPKKDE